MMRRNQNSFQFRNCFLTTKISPTYYSIIKVQVLVDQHGAILTFRSGALSALQLFSFVKTHSDPAYRRAVNPLRSCLVLPFIQSVFRYLAHTLHYLLA